MKKIFFLPFGFTCNTSQLISQNKPDTVRTGIYLKPLFDFNSSAFSYDVDLWMWFSYKK